MDVEVLWDEVVKHQLAAHLCHPLLPALLCTPLINSQVLPQGSI